MNESTISSPSFFQDAKPAAVRLWHWLSVFLLVCSLATVIFGSTMFRTKDNITMVQEQVARKGGSVDEAQARSVAHEFSDKLWMLHKYIGYGLAFLLLGRVVTESVTSSEQKVSTRIKRALGYSAGFERNHYLATQVGYAVFYILFILMAMTGMVLAYEDQKWLDPIHDPSKSIHKFVQWGIYAYLILHIGGTLVAELTRYPGIVSRMISGQDKRS